VWPKYDKDGSGQLSREEAMSFLRNTFTGTAPSQFAALFELIDEDGSNRVTKAELIKFMRENCE
jgi:Ca2+-binding EF-hand superfamily protein